MVTYQRKTIDCGERPHRPRKLGRHTVQAGHRGVVGRPLCVLLALQYRTLDSTNGNVEQQDSQEQNRSTLELRHREQ